VTRLADTHGVQFELVRHFLRRMFDGEWSSSPGQWRSAAIGAFSLFLPAGLLLVREGAMDPKYASKYRLVAMAAGPEGVRAAAIADEIALVTLTLCVTGLIALLEWQSLFPSGRDYLALASLPVRSRQIFTARFTSVLLFSAVIIAAMNLLPSLLAPIEFGGGWQLDSAYLSHAIAQGAASGLACVFVFFAILALQGVLLNVLPASLFARISVYVQGMLAGLFLLGGFYSWSMKEWRPETIARLPEFGAWLPPVWFTGLDRKLIGEGDSFFAAMAQRAQLAAGIAVVLAIVTYFISYRRYRKLLLEAPVRLATPKVWRWSLLRLLARTPRREAVMDFLAKTLARSRTHRLMWLVYLGAALAVVLNSSLIDGAVFRRSQGWSKALRFLVLFWPLACSVVILNGFRHVLSIPAELRANWIFQITESQGRAEWMSAVERFVMAYAVAPIYLILFPVAGYVLGWPMAFRMTVLQLLVSLSLFELLFHSWQKLPFTCSYIPGRRPLVGIVAGYTGVLCAIVPMVSVMIAVASQVSFLFPVYLLNFGALWVWLRRRRREGWGEARLIYEDTPAVVTDLGIKELTYAGTAAQLRVPADPVDAASHTDAPVPASTSRWLRLRTAFRRRQLERDLEDELQFHLAKREESWRLQGAVAADARYAARRQFGNVLSVKEACREVWTLGWIEALWQDVRYGCRQLRLNRGFTVVTATTLALGIAATTTIYGVCDALVWKTPPMADPDTLVTVLEAFPGSPHLWSPSSPGDVEDIRRNDTLLANLASWENGSANIVDAGGEPWRVDQARVTANFFDVLGVAPELGRSFQPGEDQPGREREVVLSDGLWRNRFQADRGIVGNTIRLNDQDYTVIGVMPPKFAFPRASKELWTPLAFTPEERNSRNAPRIDSVGRLKPGHTLRQVESELNGLGLRLEKLYPATNAKRRFLAWPVRRYVVGYYAAQFARLLLGAALFVLLIACVNVANLQFARGTARWREVSVRLALGASRRRVVAQLVTESMVLALAGAGLGVALAWYGLRAIRTSMPVELQTYSSGWNDLGLNPGVLAFVFAAAVCSGILAGLAPALQSSRPNLTESLKEGGRASSSGRGRHRLRSALLAAEIALTVVLLAGAGLMIRGFHNLVGAQTAIEPGTLLTLRLELNAAEYRTPERVAEFYRQVLERTAALPGVRAVAAASALPYSLHARFGAFAIQGRQAQSGRQPGAQMQTVSPDYFRTMNIPLRAGRFLSDRDGPRSPLSAVISEEMAREWWPGEPSPIGRQISLPNLHGPWITIVGVVGGVRASVLDRVPHPAFYVPYTQFPERGMDIAIRSARDPLAMAAPVRLAIRAVDREQPVTNIMTLETMRQNEAIGLTYTAVLMSIFGSIALLLSCVGVYGMTAYLVSAQTHEIGIRMALGAGARNVLGMVFRRGLHAALAGVTVGVLLAFALARLLASIIWGVSATDPATFTVIPLVLVLAAGLAIYVPARRAVKIDPMVALRSE